MARRLWWRLLTCTVVLVAVVWFLNPAMVDIGVPRAGRLVVSFILGFSAGLLAHAWARK